MDEVRVGIIGIGGMGGSHAKQFAEGKIPGAVLTAVCDVKAERREWAAENLGDKVQVFETAEALFAAKLSDAIVVATPHYDHPPLAIKGFENGLHVLIEKPAGVYTKQVREMNEAATKSGLVFSIMLNQRQRPLHQKFKELIDSGELGNIMRTNWIISNWFRSQAYFNSGGWRASWRGEGGGVLLNQCPHNLDLWQWICGMPKRVRSFCAFGKYHDIEVEDDVTAFVEYENGATGLFVTSTGEAPGTNRLEVVGDRGKIIMEADKLTFWRTRTGVAQFSKETEASFEMPECWTCEIPIKGNGEEHIGVLKNWTNAILKGEKLQSPGIEGIHSLELSNAMLLSAWTDEWVSLPVDEDLYFEKLQERIKTSRYVKKEPTSSQTVDVGGSFN